MALDPGTQLGPFEITAAIGAGGMGEVYSARDTRLDRQVAIKVLPTDFAGNAELLARFQREAQAISSLNHPHICTLFDIGEEDGSYFLVMELIEGESLADVLTRGPLPLPQVLKYGAQIAEALDAAHQQGIVHRDLKPGNVMITRTGAKLLDFGLATALETSPPIQSSTQMETQAAPLTQKGTILGTFQYMAPEQLEGLEADARTDIFGFGALLYEMATGRRAFEGELRTSLIAAIISSQPAPISQVTKVTPPALDQLVFKCLEKDPEDRWQSARDIASQLRWIGEAGSQAGLATTVTVHRKTRKNLAWGLAAVDRLQSLLGHEGTSAPGQRPSGAPLARSAVHGNRQRIPRARWAERSLLGQGSRWQMAHRDSRTGHRHDILRTGNRQCFCALLVPRRQGDLAG
jgi:serine/threonine protein kinase